MKLGSVLKMVLEFINDAISGVLDTVQTKVESFLEKHIPRLIKGSVLLLFFSIGFVFLLVGSAQFLTDYMGWYDGMGYLVVGLVLVLLGLIVNALR